MIKRKDGSYSRRGLWDNIRANKGSGKKPTKEMLQQEKKIRAEEKPSMKSGGRLYQAYKQGGTVGGFPDRYKKMGFSGVDKPKRTTGGNKSHAVVTKVGGNYKLIRFGQKGVTGSPDGSARNKAFKARHAKNIAKGKSSAAYWANRVKW